MLRFFIPHKVVCELFRARGFWYAVVVAWMVANLRASPVSAQDDFFKPVFEPTPTKKAESAAPIFSFARFEPEFRGLCRELENDGKRQRLVDIARAGVEREKKCITCRSLWKMVVAACSKLGPRPTPKPKPQKKGKRDQGTQETPAPADTGTEAPQSSAETTDDSGAEGLTPTPTQPDSLPQLGGKDRVRYPSTVALDEASKVSTHIYELDSGDGQLAEMFRYLAQTVRGTPDLTATEREYFDIFLTYLLAAWAGREDSTKLPPPTPGPELDEFFE